VRVVLFGTPAFAVPSLAALSAAGHDVVAVVTRPDRSQGRSRSTLIPPPVKVAALASDIPVLQPDKPLGHAFESALAGLDVDLGVVVAYGHILRPHVLAIPRLGMVNVHASLLPRWRGAAPIPWAIASGDRESGVSIMRMTAGLDSGPVWAMQPVPITDATSAGVLTAELAEVGASLLLRTIPAIAAGTEPQPQDEAGVTLAPKVGRATARIDWTRPAAEVARHIRAFDPVPGAWTTLGATEVKLFTSHDARRATRDVAPGTVLAAGDQLQVAASDGAVAVGEVQPAGKRRQPVAPWVRGRGVTPGARFE
jgi:methionyl-tRNA formyltransferase